MDRVKFKGIFPALLTPMLEDDTIDYPSLERHIDRLMQEGVDGFYVGGSTAEAFLLRMDERKRILETAVRTVAGKSTVIAHIGCISTGESIELARHAAEVGADAVSAVAPFYYKAGMEQLCRHYESIMDASELPMIIYHFPEATGVRIPLDFYERMAEHPRCLGVKFTSHHLFELQQIRARCGEDFLIFNGHDEVYAAGAMMGADGAIGSTFNMIAPLFVRMMHGIRRDEWSTVRKLQAEANRIIGEMLVYDVIPFEKEICRLQGRFRTSKVRSPLKQLSKRERNQIAELYGRFFAQ